MTECELLKLAAKAAGIELTLTLCSDGSWFAGREHSFKPAGGLGSATSVAGWNPLEDDGDALRLAVKLHIDIQFYWNGCDDQYDEVKAYTHDAGKDAEEQIGFYGSGQIDEFAATRRAIVRAAAEIGKSIP